MRFDDDATTDQRVDADLDCDPVPNELQKSSVMVAENTNDSTAILSGYSNDYSNVLCEAPIQNLILLLNIHLNIELTDEHWNNPRSWTGVYINYLITDEMANDWNPAKHFLLGYDNAVKLVQAAWELICPSRNDGERYRIQFMQEQAKQWCIDHQVTNQNIY
jgi:hypothetical protein